MVYKYPIFNGAPLPTGSVASPLMASLGTEPTLRKLMLSI
jgi:hypothetical protein